MPKRPSASPLFSARRATEDLVRFLYLEPLLPDKDVLVVAPGPAAETTGFLGRLRVREAAQCDPPERAPLPSDMTAVRGRADARPGEARGLAFRDDAFDVVFVPEVAVAPDPGVLFKEVVRVLRPDGLALVATRNASCLSPISIPPEGGHAEVWTYSRLLALLRTFFPSVRMVGQGPFLGYTFVEYDPRRIPDVRLDTTLLEGRGEDPEFFVAVCAVAATPADLPLPALFQVPLEEFTVAELTPEERGVSAVSEADAVAALTAEEEAMALRGEVEKLREELAERNVRIARLEQEVVRAEEDAAGARDRAAKLVRDMEADRRTEQRKAIEATFAKAARKADWSPPPAVQVQVGDEETTRPGIAARDLEVEALEHKLREAERRAAEAEEKARETERRAAEAEQKAREAERRVAEAEQAHLELAEAERALKAAGERAAAAEAARAAAEAARDAAERAVAAAEIEALAHVQEIEAKLRSAGRRVRELEAAVEERDRMLEELLRELRYRPEPEVAAPAVEPAEVARAAAAAEADAVAAAWAAAEGHVAALRESLAALEGELTGARWRNAELEAALAETIEETTRLDGEAEQLRRALEVAQIAAEELVKTGAERDAEIRRLRSEIERLAPLEDQVKAVGRLVDELRRRAAELQEVLDAREDELRRLKARP